ncbi:hypothetical protein [Helicobacter felis]|uniref:hypothetical protein n=1 Tax=Helicobacter felis TaxID=214 RepID=UPI000CF02AB8|nr:hypothetical protein [Helicobacter felis]
MTFLITNPERSFIIKHPNAQDLLTNMREVFTLIEQGNKPYKDHLPNLSLEYFDGTYFKSFILVDEKSLFQENKTCIAENLFSKLKKPLIILISVSRANPAVTNSI